EVLGFAFEPGDAAAVPAEVAAGVEAEGCSSSPQAATARARTTVRHMSARIARRLTTLSGVRAWTTELEFAYEHGHAYLLDGAGHWSDCPRMHLRHAERD